MNLPRHVLKTLSLMLARPEGIIIVTGPTGSGKTTTLYSLLSQINAESVNIMTLEDPVEYPMTMMRQTSVNEAAKIDFANGIRSMMRQDPDIILVGEIRDQETAEMAFRAAMTGHQVFSTLHTNSALGAFPRLLDIGILPDIMAGNIIGVIAQRLVRKLCTHCKEAYSPSTRGAPAARRGAPTPALKIYRPVGCKQCNNHGYRGPHRDHGDPAHGRRSRRAGRAPRDRARAARRGRRERLSRRWSKKASRASWTASTSIAEVARSVDLTQRFPLIARARRAAPAPSFDIRSFAMPAFHYKAVDKLGRPARGKLDAVNEVDLELRLKRMGLDLITFRAIRGGRTTLASAQPSRAAT